jgi:hypothetical protein
MNKKQEEILYKEFKVNDRFTITRNDYESFPCAMVAYNWTDEQMEELAKEVGEELEGYAEWYDDLDCEGYEEDFWIAMENIAVKRGMQYYEDLSDEEYKKACEEWRDIE